VSCVWRRLYGSLARRPWRCVVWWRDAAMVRPWRAQLLTQAGGSVLCAHHPTGRAACRASLRTPSASCAACARVPRAGTGKGTSVLEMVRTFEEATGACVAAAVCAAVALGALPLLRAHACHLPPPAPPGASHQHQPHTHTHTHTTHTHTTQPPHTHTHTQPPTHTHTHTQVPRCRSRLWTGAPVTRSPSGRPPSLRRRSWAGPPSWGSRRCAHTSGPGPASTHRRVRCVCAVCVLCVRV
jgi:hypothetical protein